MSVRQQTVFITYVLTCDGADPNAQLMIGNLSRQHARREELEAFFADMIAVADTLEAVADQLAADVPRLTREEIAEQISGLAGAYAAQIRERAIVLARGNVSRD